MTQIYSLDTAYKQKLLGNPTNDLLGRFLDTVGDGSGTKNMNVAADEYFIKPGADLIYVIDKVSILIEDDAVLDPAGFGGRATLTTGCLLKVQEDNGGAPHDIVDLTDGIAIKTNGELALIGHLTVADGAASCFVQCDVSLGAPIRLDGNRNERLLFETQDLVGELGNLVKLYVFVAGRIFKDLAR